MAYLYDAAYESGHLATMKAKGAAAVSHYLTSSYASSSPQPAAIRTAGMGALLNYEQGVSELVGATRPQGRDIARRAVAAVDAGCPRDGSVAIYFSVDTDVSSRSLSSCDEGFRGVVEELAGRFRAAVYGEGDLIDHLVNGKILTGKHWLSMSEGFGGFNAASSNVCLVQMHDGRGNWIGTDIPGTDRNTITDAAALDAWWPAGSPYAKNEEDMALTPEEHADLEWIKGKVDDGLTRAQSQQLYNVVLALNTALASLLPRVAQLQADVSALKSPPSGGPATVDVHAVASAVASEVVPAVKALTWHAA
jgi:glycoside hydrolase-like protein